MTEKTVPDQFILLDTESVDGQEYLSEVYMLLVNYTPETGFTLGRDLHLLVRADRRRMKKSDDKKIFKEVTGLSYATLSKHGSSYSYVISQVRNFIHAFPNAVLIA